MDWPNGTHDVFGSDPRPAAADRRLQRSHRYRLRKHETAGLGSPLSTGRRSAVSVGASR
jgi:hypothetical protein